MKFLTRYAANDQKNNISAEIREKRIQIFVRHLEKLNLPNSFSILDIGGTNYFWDLWKEKIPFPINLTLLNMNEEATEGYNSIIMDANYLEKIETYSFDVIFSNSLIEHLGSWENQVKFSTEIQRISKHFFIQTPAFIFPVEPHFLFPFFHWFPKYIRILLLRNFNLGWFDKESDKLKARKLIDEIRILKKRDLKKMFANAHIITEWFLFLPKSYIITNMNLK